jgi:hypothetical protein
MWTLIRNASRGSSSIAPSMREPGGDGTVDTSTTASPRTVTNRASPPFSHSTVAPASAVMILPP